MINFWNYKSGTTKKKRFIWFYRCFSTVILFCYHLLILHFELLSLHIFIKCRSFLMCHIKICITHIFHVTARLQKQMLQTVRQLKHQTEVACCGLRITQPTQTNTGLCFCLVLPTAELEPSLQINDTFTTHRKNFVHFRGVIVFIKPPKMSALKN